MAIQTEFYKNNPYLPRANLPREYTEWEIQEYKKCAEDPVYFARTYFKIVHLDKGLIPLDLYDFQEEMIIKCRENRNIVSVQSRQSGKSTTATVVLLHEVIFNKNKTVAILANKAPTAREILKRIKTAFEHLPKFLKPGVIEWNKSSVTFDNGCIIMAEASSSDNIRGRSINILFLDEMAFIPGWEDFAAGVLPTISSGGTTKLIITSTPNGLGPFYEIVEGARKKKNGFALVEVPWWRVPGRDEEWKQKTLAQLNFDQQKFEQEYEIEFMGSSGTLINGAALKLLEASVPIHEHDNLKVYKTKRGNHLYALIVDSSEGKGLDYSAFSVIDITAVPYEQVATFRSNTITPQDYARIINVVCKQYNDPYMLIELNAPAGSIVSELMFWDYEYENLIFTENLGKKGKKISMGLGNKKVDKGIFTSKPVKATGCTMLKLLVEQKQLLIWDKETIDELKVFSKKNNSYEAEEGKHDDLTMGLVLFGWLAAQQYFKQITDNDINKALTERTDPEIDDYVNGLGVLVVNTGMDDFDDPMVQNHVPVYF